MLHATYEEQFHLPATLIQFGNGERQLAAPTQQTLRIAAQRAHQQTLPAIMSLTVASIDPGIARTLTHRLPTSKTQPLPIALDNVAQTPTDKTPESKFMVSVHQLIPFRKLVPTLLNLIIIIVHNRKCYCIAENKFSAERKSMKMQPLMCSWG